MKPVSVEQVARRAGVAKSTVSFVLNNKGNVSPETREKVLATIKELGYTRDKPRSAQPAKTADEKNIVVYINPKIRYSEAASEYIAGLRRSAKANDFSLTLAITSSLSEAENQFSFLEEAAQPSGIVLVGVNPDDFIVAKALELKIPSVVINRVIDHPDISYVSINHEEAGVDAARYLLGLGHRHFAFVIESDYNHSELGRFNGFLKELANYGQAVKLALVRQFSENIRQFEANPLLADLIRSDILPLIEAQQFTAPKRVELIQLKPQLPNDFAPTCLVAANDTVAIKVQDDLLNYGVKIPQEVSVMGFNNRATDTAIKPPLTTVDESWQQQGYTAGQILIELAEYKERRSQKILLRHRLIERGSTGKVS